MIQIIIVDNKLIFLRATYELNVFIERGIYLNKKLDL